MNSFPKLSVWLAVRIFAAFFLTLFGAHFVFTSDEHLLLAGALVGALGLTLLALTWLHVTGARNS